MNFSLGNKKIGNENPCFIIAEAGVNHNGSLEIAKKLVDAAVEAKTDAIKFQTFDAEELATPNVEKAEYQKTKEGESQLEMLKKLQLGEEDFKMLKDYCEGKNIIFLSTPFDFKSADLLERLDVRAYKVSSGDLNNYPFLAYLAKKGKPIIISTGMGELLEIERAVRTIKEEGEERIAILQCTSSYPAPFEEVHLNVIKTLRKQFDLPIGFSDHTPGIEASIAAVALGACVIEKHFTLDKNMSGPDHKASIDVPELKMLVSSIRNVEKALGSAEKKIVPSEEKVREVVRKRVVAYRDIRKGESVAAEMLGLKRSLRGEEPENLSKMIGKKAKRDIKKDEPVSFDDLE